MRLAGKAYRLGKLAVGPISYPNSSTTTWHLAFLIEARNKGQLPLFRDTPTFWSICQFTNGHKDLSTHVHTHVGIN